MKEFVSAAKAKEKSEVIEPIEFNLDGKVYRAYPPTESLIALVVAATTGGYKTDEEAVAAMINFAVALLSKEDHDEIVRKLMDRDDPFEMEDLMRIMEFIIEEASGNPTKRSSGSTSSRAKTGKKSTVIVQEQESTPSDLVPVGSAT